MVSARDRMMYQKICAEEIVIAEAKSVCPAKARATLAPPTIDWSLIQLEEPECCKEKVGAFPSS